MHVRALQIRNYEFRNNLMIAPYKSGGKALVACYGSWEEIDQVAQLVSVRDNVCVGS